MNGMGHVPGPAIPIPIPVATNTPAPIIMPTPIMVTWKRDISRDNSDLIGELMFRLFPGLSSVYQYPADPGFALNV